jgi:competence protein ComEC
LACLLMPFGLEHLPLWVAAESMDVIMRLAYAVAQWRHAVVRVNAFGPEWLAVFTCGALWICIWRGRLRWLGLVPVAIAAMGVLTAPRPVALISDNGRLMAVRDAGGGWWLSNLRREKFVAESWLEREAANNAHRAAGDWRSAQDNGIIRCDSRACLYRAENGAVISFVTMPESVVEDCGLADLFIAPLARLDGKLCPRSRRRMIDTYDLRYDGAHAVYQAPGGRLTVAKVADTRGQRPWVPRPPPKPEARKRDQ